MELICFDLDNTLVKSNKIHLTAWKKAFKELNLPRKTSKEILEYFSLEGSVLVRKLFPEKSKTFRKKIVDLHDEYVVNETAMYVKVIPGAKKILKRIKKKYKIAILSNCKHKEITAIIKAAKIHQNMFDIIIGNDEVKHPKPSPDEIQKAMKKLKIKKGYMVGDSIYDIQAGKKAGLKTVAVATGNHTKTMLKKEKPDVLLNSIAELNI